MSAKKQKKLEVTAYEASFSYVGEIDEEDVYILDLEQLGELKSDLATTAKFFSYTTCDGRVYFINLDNVARIQITPIEE